MAERKVNCHVARDDSGEALLVFRVEGTNECVGEIRVKGDDRYILVMAQLFSEFARHKRGKLVIPAAVHRGINGSH